MIYSRDTSMKGSTGRVRKYRDKMKAAGLKQVAIWVPDVNAPGYAKRLKRPSRSSTPVRTKRSSLQNFLESKIGNDREVSFGLFPGIR
jgi:hypothetical protein